MELVGYYEIWEVYTDLTKKPVYIAQNEDDAKQWAYVRYLEEFYIQKKFVVHNLFKKC